MAKSIISLSDVSKTFKTDLKKHRIVALKNLNCEVHEGDVYGIVGPNGAGKSTTLKILLGFAQQDSGTVLINGMAPHNEELHKQIGYLPENPYLYKNLTITDHLKFGASIHNIPRKAALKKIEDLLERVNLLKFKKVPIGNFSKGMRQRAALAYAMLHDPKILILDEPMSGLDPLGRQLVLELIKEYSQKQTTILFCSHILTDVERICKNIAIMHQGQIAAVTTPDELTANSHLQKQTGNSLLESYFFNVINASTSRK